jgi:DNA-binding transcriptional LysR family regulator
MNDPTPRSSSPAEFPSLSTDQVAAFVQVARLGSLRAAAETLFISEQGLRSRLLALERRLGVELYRKSRGLRRRTPLTPQGEQFLPHAAAFLDRAVELCDLFRENQGPQVVDVVASQYLIAYVLIDAVRRFHAAYPQIHVRLSARTEREIEQTLLASLEFSFGVAAPYESSPDLEYRHLFSMDWSLVAPPNHPLARRRGLKLADVIRYPLIVYERGSTGRQHVVEAFQQRGLVPHVEIEATNTDLIVRMVEAGLGVGIVPLHESGAVTRGRRVAIRGLGKQVRPIHSGVLWRRGERLSTAARELLEFLGAVPPAP